MNDLLYTENYTDYVELMDKLKTQFPNIVIIDASDDVHEYRLNIELPDEQQIEYYRFIIHQGYGSISLRIMLLLQDPESKFTQKGLFDEIKKII